MDEFERRISLLLQEAVPEPGNAISTAAAMRQGRRRRAALLAVPAGAVLVAVLVTILVVVLSARTRTERAPAARPLHIGGLTLHYPAGWSSHDYGKTRPDLAPGGVHGFVSTERVTRVCPASRGGVAPDCPPGVAALPPAGVYLGYAVFAPMGPDSVGPTLDTRVAGRPASVQDEFNVDAACPRGTASSTQVVVSLGAGHYASITGCLGSGPVARQRFRTIIGSATFGR